MSQFIEMFEFEDLSLLNPSDDFSVKCIDDTSSATKVPAGEYLGNGTYAIYDQSQDCEVAGYTDSHEGLCNNYPAVLFGDHSRVVKYINQPFFIGADGVKIIRPKNDDLLAEFLYYDLLYHNIPNTGYNRHFKYVKMLKLTEASVDRQKAFLGIAHQADKSKFVGFKSQFIEMFKGDDQVPLGDICNIEKGATITRNDVLPGDIPVVAGGQEPSCYHNVANREAGAITVSASGAYAGYINLWSCPIFASDCNTVISKDAEKTDQTFVYFGLKAMQKQIYGLQKGGAQPHVYGKDLQKFMFPHPSYAKQIEFSKMAKQADKSKYIN